MRSDAEKKHPDDLTYIQEQDKYEGYIIEAAVSRSRSEQGKWMGHFRATKEDAATLYGSVANLQDTDGLARDKAVDIAKAKIDETTAGQE